MHRQRVADVRRRFDSMSGTHGDANRTSPGLSVMVKQGSFGSFAPRDPTPAKPLDREKPDDLPPQCPALVVESSDLVAFKQVGGKQLLICVL